MTVLLLSGSIAMLLVLYLRVKPHMRAVGPFLPDSFLFGIGLYTAGALFVSSAYPGPHSLDLVLMSLSAFVAALLGAVTFALVCRRYYAGVDFRTQFAGVDSGPLERASLKVLLVVSGVVCLAFVYVVLSNSIIAALLSIASLSGEANLLEARKAITAGSEGYLAPGYVKQFRDILIPIALIAMMLTTPSLRRSSAAWFGFVTAIMAMLISGQRLVFVVFFLALLLGGFYARQIVALRSGLAPPARRTPWLAVLVLLVLYGVLTVLLGRANPDLSPTELVAEISINLFDRVLFAAPLENLLTFPIWQALGPTGGGSWFADLAAVLPGVDEALSNLLHSATGGSLLGNSPLGLPPDVWLAWGWPGLVLVPFLFAFAVGLLDMLLLGSRSPLFFALKIYLFVVLPICYSPYLFVLYGGAVAFILMTFLAVLRSGAWWRPSAVAA